MNFEIWSHRAKSIENAVETAIDNTESKIKADFEKVKETILDEVHALENSVFHGVKSATNFIEAVAMHFGHDKLVRNEDGTLKLTDGMPEVEGHGVIYPEKPATDDAGFEASLPDAPKPESLSLQDQIGELEQFHKAMFNEVGIPSTREPLAGIAATGSPEPLTGVASTPADAAPQDKAPDLSQGPGPVSAGNGSPAPVTTVSNSETAATQNAEGQPSAAAAGDTAAEQPTIAGADNQVNQNI